MNRLLIFLSILILIPVASVDAQITGLWKSTDHLDDSEKSIVKIYEMQGKYFGVVEKLLPAATITHCVGCEGELKNKPLVGMVIMKDIQKKGDDGKNGKILDPSNGKFYSCDIKLESKNILKVTGYVGFSWLGKDMYWHRVEE